MARLIAFCGIDCSACNAYVATQNNDVAIIERTAKEWAELYHSEITARDVWCDGCSALSSRLCGHCAECNIRACAMSHNVASCGACPEYACDTIAAFLEMAPDLKPLLDQIHCSKKSGVVEP
jgi:hypothetical protein